MRDNMEAIGCDATGIFGLSIMGDGATIKKMPLFNILVSAVTKPPMVMSVCDSTQDLQKGIGKHGKVIATSCWKVMKEIDPDKINIDLSLIHI